MAHVAQALNGGGVDVFTYDQRHHGESSGERGYIDSLAAMVDDVTAVLAHARENASGAPWFVLGAQYGGDGVDAVFADAWG